MPSASEKGPTVESELSSRMGHLISLLMPVSPRKPCPNIDQTALGVPTASSGDQTV
jgi:hypothetical protein